MQTLRTSGVLRLVLLLGCLALAGVSAVDNHAEQQVMQGELATKDSRKGNPHIKIEIDSLDVPSLQIKVNISERIDAIREDVVQIAVFIRNQTESLNLDEVKLKFSSLFAPVQSMADLITDINGILQNIQALEAQGEEHIANILNTTRDEILAQFNTTELEAFEQSAEAFLSQWLSHFGVADSLLPISKTHRAFRAIVLALNSLYINFVNSDPSAEATFALNHLSLFTRADLLGTYCGTLPHNKTKTESPSSSSLLQSKSKAKDTTYPTSWNLASQGVVGPVLNQGSCGGCYSFSATEALEGLYAAQNKNTQYYLSQQQIIDCSTQNSGCSGGTFQAAWTYIANNPGVTSAEVYPFTSGSSGKTGTCNTNDAQEGVLTLTPPAVWYDDVYTSVDTDEDMQAAAYTQPVSIAIQASSSCFQNYKSGVLTPENCNCGTNVDHAVLLTGWGVTSSGTEYWIVKNSWGTNWGNQGYVWIARLPESTNYCGMYQQSAYPNTAILSSQCSGSSPPSYCQPAQAASSTNGGGSSGGSSDGSGNSATSAMAAAKNNLLMACILLVSFMALVA